MKLALIGVGLIGASFARAAAAAGAVTEVIGFDVDSAALTTARQLGVIHGIAASPAEAVRGADLVVLALPLGAMPDTLQAIAAHLAPHAIVTDVGSAKAAVIDAARTALGARFVRFVPGHPIAGRERSGVAASDAGLFDGKLYITTPVRETDPAALAHVEALWRKLGCRVQAMDAEEHDRIFASVSHLPHLLAFALVAQIAGEADAQRKLGMAGAGFRDFTRIAASSPVMWRDVCLANRKALGAELAAFRGRLDELQAALAAADGPRLEAEFETAAACRRDHSPRLDAE